RKWRGGSPMEQSELLSFVVDSGKDRTAVLRDRLDRRHPQKMEAYREGGSEKHLRDITGVLKISGAHLDHSYIKGWADRLGTSDIWREILRRVG
ncbi:MAG: hypothetical protein ACREMY_08150, partial [bacterium]